MASILRSSKFARYIVGFTRNFTLNPPIEIERNTLQNGQCICNSILTRSLASQIAAAHNTQNDQSLERSLRRLDQDVRRSGRISRRDIEDVLEEIRFSRSASSSQSLLVIRCCGNLVPEEKPTVRTQLVQEIWKTLNKLNVPMDISHYNALLRVYLENEYQFSPTQFLSELEAKNIEPNRVTYQRLIARYCQDGDIEGATQILEYMREKQLPVNENVFNALIMGHSHADDMESAKGMLSVMQQAGLQPSADTYTTLLCGYARKGDIEAIKSTIQQCEEADISLLDKDYMDIIFALAKNNHGQHVSFLLSKMRKSIGYNQDAINLILKLTNFGQEDIAMEVFKTMPRTSRNGEETTPAGGFFITQLVKANRPTEKILSICQYLLETDLNPRALLIATDAALHECNEELVYALLDEMKKRNIPIRPHYFWPLLVHKAKNGTSEDVANVLRTMTQKFNLKITGETLRDYVIPNLKLKNTEKVILLLRDAGISTASALTNIVYYHLVEHNLQSAAGVSNSFNAFYAPSVFRRPLALAYIATKDTENYIKVLHRIVSNLHRANTVSTSEDNESGSESTEKNTFDPEEITGLFVIDVAVLNRQQSVDNVTNILNALVASGLGISNKTAEQLHNILAERLTPEISSALAKLTSDDLPSPKTLEKGTVSLPPSAAFLEKLLATAEEKGENTNGIKRQLLTLYCKNKETEKVKKCVEELRSDPKFELTSGFYAQLIDYFTQLEDLETALSYADELAKKHPEASIDDVKVIKLAHLMIKNNRFDEAIKYISSQKRNRKLEERSFGYNTICWKLLTTLADEGRAEELQKLFDTLVENDFIELNNVMLGPLVKVHLVNKNIDEAMKVFENACNKHRCTPWKNELTCKLIQNEDAVNLQKLTDLSTSIHGEVNSLYDLVFAFVECGRVRQARKILETPGLRNRQSRVDTICERYSTEGQVDPLEGLVEATKDLHHIDRANIFQHLLNTYIKQDKVEEALGLWTRMQEEDTQPTDSFLLTLGKYLKHKGVQVPFVMPKTNNLKPEKQVVQSKSKPQPVKVSDDLFNFRKAIKTANLDEALQYKQKLNTNQLSVLDQSLLVELLVKGERLHDAKKHVIEMLNQNLHPIPRVFRFFLNKLAQSGDCETMNLIGKRLDQDVKKMVSFDNRLCHANIVAGKSADFLKKMETDIIAANGDPNKIQELANAFPRGGILGILDAHPELIPQFEKISKIYAENGIISPLNVLWMKYFIENRVEESKRIWDEHLVNTPRLMFQRVVQQARDTKDDKLIQRLIDQLKTATISEGALGNVYSCLLDILISKEQMEEALKVLNTAISDISAENINRTALLRLQNGLQKLGKQLPCPIPTKNAKSSTSSSSDDETEPKTEKVHKSTV